MSDSFLDHIPSREREKIRKKLRSPEAYERLREKVKGPEDLEKEMESAEKMAELSFALETDPQMQEKVKTAIERDLKEQGIDAVLDTEKDMPEDVRTLLEEGKFSVAVSSHPQTHDDTITLLPEGNVQDRIPVKTKLSNAYAGTALGKKE